MRYRAEFERQLRQPLTEVEIVGLGEGGHIRDIDLGATTVAEVIKKYFHLKPGPVGKRSLDETLRLSEPILARANALALLYARLAAKDDEVIELREDLAPAPGQEELGAWVDRQRCEAFGLDGPDGVVQATNALLGSREPKARLTHPDTGYDVDVPADSILGRVAIIAGRLQTEYPWRYDRTVRWLICGDPPPKVVSAVINYDVDPSHGVETDTRSRVILKLDPAISPEEVARIYSKARASIAPVRVRPLDTKALARATFVLEQPEGYEFRSPAGGDGPPTETWYSWLGRWNRGPGQRHGRYSTTGQSRLNFRRDCRKAMHRLAWAGWMAAPSGG